MFHFLPISLSFILFGSINKDIIWLRTLMFFGSILFLLYAFFELTTDIIPVIILNTLIIICHVYYLVDLIILKQIQERKIEIQTKQLQIEKEILLEKEKNISEKI